MLLFRLAGIYLFLLLSIKFARITVGKKLSELVRNNSLEIVYGTGRNKFVRSKYNERHLIGLEIIQALTDSHVVLNIHQLSNEDILAMSTSDPVENDLDSSKMSEVELNAEDSAIYWRKQYLEAHCQFSNSNEIDKAGGWCLTEITYDQWVR